MDEVVAAGVGFELTGAMSEDSRGGSALRAAANATMCSKICCT